MNIGDDKIKFWCQKILPLVYDDSLSYYEILDKVVVYINQNIEDINTIIDEIGNIEGDIEDVRAELEEIKTEIENIIDDDVVSTDTTFSSSKIMQIFNNYFTKMEVNALLNDKADAVGLALSYDSSENYKVGDYCIDNYGLLLKCIENTTGEFDENVWILANLTDDLKNILTIISENFDESKYYNEGDYCIYDGVLYKCTHYSHGAWNSSYWTDTNIGKELKFANGQISYLNDFKMDTLDVAELYDENETYNEGDYCFYGGVLFKSNTTIDVPEEFNRLHWDDILICDELKSIYDDIYPVVDVDFVNVVNFETDVALPLRSCNAKIVSQQANGTPSPSNPLPITGFASMNVIRAGKNLYPIKVGKDIFTNNRGATHTVNNDILSITTTAENNSGVYGGSGISINNSICQILNKIKTTVTVSLYAKASINSTDFYFGFQNLVNTVATLTTSWQKVTIPAYNFNGIPIINFYNRSGSAVTVDIKDLQIEIGYNSTDYDEYKGITINIDFGQTVYGGELNVLTGELTIDWVSFDMGTVDWMYANTGVFYINSTALSYRKKDGFKNIKCERYLTSDVTSAIGNINDFEIRGQNTNGIFGFKDSTLTQEAGVKSALNGVKAIYELAEPIIVNLSPLVIESDVGINNVFCDTGETSLTYIESIKKYIDSIYTDITGILITGQTNITLYDNSITTDSTIDIYTSIFGVNPTAITVTNGSITLTFNSQITDVYVKVRVS